MAHTVLNIMKYEYKFNGVLGVFRGGRNCFRRPGLERTGRGTHRIQEVRGHHYWSKLNHVAWRPRSRPCDFHLFFPGVNSRITP